MMIRSNNQTYNYSKWHSSNLF